MRNKLPEADQPGRFHQTIIRYDDEPVYVRVEESETFTLNGLYDGSTFKNKKVPYDDPKIDISTPPLGWINTYYAPDSEVMNAVYIERVPTRQYKQGLCGQNVRGYYFLEGKGDGLQRLAASYTRDFLFTRGYEECVKGVYPSLDRAIKIIQQATAVAISKNITLRSSKGIIKVFFKTSEVGWFDPISRIVKVPKEQDAWIISKYLSELDWKVE